MVDMKRHKITSAGQISIPAEVRHRWGANAVLIDDQGDRLVVRPLADDPIASAKGALRDARLDSGGLRAEARADEAGAEARR
jgi:bifunctional DNA-binding transcriptional regulator/antitoxin component of YhaV-PrlF toxin-antitoxin module